MLATIVAFSELLISAGCALTAGGSGTKVGTGSSEAPGALTAASTSVSFGNITVGQAGSQNVAVVNTGSSNVMVSSVSITGSGFSATEITNVTLDPNQSMTIQVSFKPSGSGLAQGTLSISSDASDPVLQVQVSGTGVIASGVLTASQGSLSFGNVNVGISSTQTVTFTNTGNANLTISTVSVNGIDFTVSGGSNTTLGPNQSVPVSVVFNPTAAGLVQGNLSVSSNASDSVVQLAISGTGISQPTQPIVNLSWQASASSNVIGYNVYRGTQAGNLTRLNPSLDSLINYSDNTVAAGQTYVYAVTSVNSSNVESTQSTPLTVTVPSN